MRQFPFVRRIIADAILMPKLVDDKLEGLFEFRLAAVVKTSTGNVRQFTKKADRVFVFGRDPFVSLRVSGAVRRRISRASAAARIAASTMVAKRSVNAKFPPHVGPWPRRIEIHAINKHVRFR